MTARSVSVSKTNCLEDLDDDEAMDLQALGKALFEAGTLASQPKKQHGNQQSKTTVVTPSPLMPNIRLVDMEAPGKSCFMKEAFNTAIKLVCCVTC